MARMMSGADLAGGRTPAAAPGQMTGAQLAQGPMPEQPDAQGESGELDEAIAAVLQAAQSQGFDLPPEGVPGDQLPQVYAQILEAASKAPEMQTDAGIALIERLAKSLGLPSPYGAGDAAAPDYAFGGEEPEPFDDPRNQTPVPPGFHRR